MSLQETLFGFEGRLRRRDWWVAWIGMGLVSYVVTSIIAPLVLGIDGRPEVDPQTFSVSYPVPLLIALLGTTSLLMWPYLAVSVKRAHDRGRSGRFVAGLLMATTIVAYAPHILKSFLGVDVGAYAWVATGVSGAVSLWLLVVLGFLDGAKGPNRYGPSPKGLGDQADTFT